ncbi:site-specific recombinase [Neisseria animalis]|uniref:Recombinase n=1 Tax=Neisseria animalis TaxID=492 RepID=A0A5P3MR46_NEIAN|nr:recombinase [Neisseria animalis]QEY23189.1 recombinase [Neisseria animalis]ROW31763.1 recombinase [Neisseria animalis]VEE08345.1 site-specific recombinase [Neisseria animalis]
MKKLTPQNLHSVLSERIGDADFVSVLNALIQFLRSGGKKNAAARFDQILITFRQDEALCRQFGDCFYLWLAKIHVYPALIKLGIFSRNSFAREMIDRIYERFSPSYKDLNNLLEVFLYLFQSENDDRWLSTISLRQWLNLYELIQRHAADSILQTTSRQLSEARIRAIEMLAIWVASEALQPEFVRLAPRLLAADSAFVGLQRETALLVEHYRHNSSSYDTAHLEVMFDQCQTQVIYLRRRGTGAGSGSSIQVAHLLERLQQTLDRLKLLINIQTQEQRNRLVISLMNSMIYAAVEQYSTRHLRKSSVRMLTRSITENTSNRGEHYITRNRKEYLNMLYSAAGGGVIIALMALHKIHIAGLGFGEFTTAFLSGLNYGLGFMLIHVLHCTVATKQPAMTAASFAEQVELNERGRAVDNKLAKLLIDVCRSQSVAVFGNVGVAVLLAGLISTFYALQTGNTLLSAEDTAYQFKSIDVFTQPTLWYAAIAGVWLFCSGIIAGFFDNRADYLDLRRRLTINPLLRRIMPAKLRSRFAVYIHKHYGSLMGNFIFGMLLGLTGFFGHLLGLPLDIRHVAFSSANLGYAAISGEVGVIAFMYGMFGVLAIGTVNLMVSFTLALFVALRSRGTQLGSLRNILKSVWLQVKNNPLQLVYPQTEPKSEGKTDNKP